MGNGSRSRVYFSKSFESTSGVAATPDISFRVNDFDLNQDEQASVDDQVSGLPGATGVTREMLTGVGGLDVPLAPGAAAWSLKMLFGSSPTSGLVAGGTSTVYEHVWDTDDVSDVLKSFTAFRQNAGIAGFTEKYPGTYIKSWSLKSGTGKVGLIVPMISLGECALGDSEPVVTADREGYHVGQGSQVKVGGTALAAGVVLSDWSVMLDPMIDHTNGVGGSDLTSTRIDFKGLRKVTASLTINADDRSKLDDFVAETTRPYEFLSYGPLIDAGSGLKSLVAVKLMKARILGRPKIRVAHGVFTLPLQLEGLFDDSNLDVTIRVRNLVASY